MTKTRIPNEYLLSDVGPRQNQLINGGLENWQRGNGPFTGNGVINSDRWMSGTVGTDTISVSKDTTNIDGVLGSQTCAACTFTLGTGGGVTNIAQQLKSEYQLAQRTISFSVRIRTNVANAVRIGLYNGGGWTYSSFHSGSGTYETLTVPNITVIAGSATNVQLSIFFAASCTAYIDNAMLTVGSVAADYKPLTPADDLARCQRYYETVQHIYQLFYSAATGQNLNTYEGFHATKTVTPTVTKIGTWTASNCNQPTVSDASFDGYTLGISPTAAGQIFVSNTSNPCISVEANP